MADSRGRGEDPPPNPVVRHGRVPDPAAVSPVQGGRATPPRPGPGAPPREWPGPVLRRLRDPLPDGYAPRFGRRARGSAARATGTTGTSGTAGTTGTTGTAGATGTGGTTGAGVTGEERGREGDGRRGRRVTDRGPRPAGMGPRPPQPSRGERATVRVPGPQDPRTADVPDVDPELATTYDDAVSPEPVLPLHGPEPGPLSAVHRKLGKSLVPGERVLVAQTRHPVVMAEPVLSSLLLLLGIAAVSPYLGAADIARNALMVLWAALAVRALWAWLQWSNDYFVVTDRRLMRLHGLLDVQRDMMPLTKVTDMAFQRPFWGRPFNYGRFVLESAGMDQALREITFVRDPENVDAIIGRQVFSKAPYQRPGPGR